MIHKLKCKLFIWLAKSLQPELTLWMNDYQDEALIEYEIPSQVVLVDMLLSDYSETYEFYRSKRSKL
jgi:hypothetical protein